MAGTRRQSAADDPELDAWARRGRELTRRDERERYPVAEHDLDVAPDDEYSYADYGDDDIDDGIDDGLEEEPELFCGTGEQPRDSRDQDDEPEPVDPEPALPRLRPAPPPALPAGTSLVEVDEEDPELYDLDGPVRPGYRRAAGE
jgi:hypothetical protein